ncbi:MAG: hypothetical protein PVG38_17610 [Gammaproteobacteria bacterium]|jgi:hypothetical protein
MYQRSKLAQILWHAILCLAFLAAFSGHARADGRDHSPRRDLTAIDGHNLLFAVRQLNQGRQIFRFDTFGDEAFWGDTLRLHEAIAGEANGGVGEGVSPATALALGLKVDVTALPPRLLNQLRHGRIDLDDPATTLALLKLDAVVGVTGIFDEADNLLSMGIQCALCHSTVDDSFATGIGRRLDGWANRDLNVGAIIAAAPDLSFFANLLGVGENAVRDVLNSWEPGKFDAALVVSGLPAGAGPTLIPPAFGLAGVNLHTWTGWGGVPHWNAFVAILEMGGRGTFYDPRLQDASRFPVAAANGFDDGRPPAGQADLVTSKLPALHLYQLSLAAPEPPKGSFDAEAASRGEDLFNGKADCSRCHVPPLYTEPGWNLHTPDEIGIDAVQANRSPDGGYRTSPLRGLWTHTQGGFFHDGRFPTLAAVVDHYNSHFALGLSEAEQADLVEFLISL